MKHPKPKYEILKPSKVYYSGNGRSYTGTYHARCTTGSKWRIAWNRDQHRIEEKLLDINTDTGKVNTMEVGKWLAEVQ